MYIRFLLSKFIELIAFILGLFVYPLAYLMRRWSGGPLKMFANNDEKNFTDNWYGDPGWRAAKGIDLERQGAIGKFITSYRWGALRNPHWNLKLWLGRGMTGKTHWIRIRVHRGEASAMTWRNKVIFGAQFTVFKRGKKKYFRYSFTRELWRLSPWRILGYRYINVMLGAGETRWISKLRFFK